MNLLYLLGSLAGVGLIVLLNALLLGRAQTPVDAAAAEALLAGEHPGFAARRVSIARDGRGALLEDRSGALYLVVPAGDALVSRVLSGSLLRGVVRDGAALALRLHDVTFPGARLLFADEAEAQAWQARLVPLLGSGNSK